ncbi:MAG: thiolase family protein [Planctomycetes bacterium]|nr:thiolase family protein [Planctomycetota bacterium]
MTPRESFRPVAVLAAVRSPIGKFLGGLEPLTAREIAVPVVRAALVRAGVEPGEVGQLVFGNARQAGGGPNVARQIGHFAGLPQEVPACTLNMACASGLAAIEKAADAIRLGRVRVAVAGGTESMSRLPFLLPRMRRGHRLGHDTVVDGMYRDGFDCPLCGQVMGRTAETLAQEYGIGRQEQDEYALESQARCRRATEAGLWSQEIVPLDVPQGPGREAVRIEADEHPRPDTTLDLLAKLPPVFKEGGTVHSGNSSGITDGAGAIVLASEEYVASRGMEPLAWVRESAQAGVDPARMGIGPIPAFHALVAAGGPPLSAYDLVELNEAFAAQVLACLRELPVPRERLNVNGGAIALGHPIGATGARIVVTLLAEMARRGAGEGLATLCVSGGLGMAVRFTRP